MTSAAVGFVSQSKHNAAGFELDFEVLVQEDCVAEREKKRIIKSIKCEFEFFSSFRAAGKIKKSKQIITHRQVGREQNF